MSDRTKIEWAVRLAELGFDVFPLRPNTKRPPDGTSWLRSCTRDPEQIRLWFEEQPDANYAAVPSEGHVVIDLDLKGDLNGVAAFAELEAGQDIGDMVSGATFTVQTPSGGRHLYLTSEEPCGNSHQFPAGIDVRGHHGYVVGPGCSIDGRDYKVLNDVEILAAPTWVAERLKRPGARDQTAEVPLFELDTETNIRRARKFLADRPGAVEGQNGDSYTYATVAAVRDFGVSEDMCLHLMLEPGGWNDRCRPPWEPHGWDNQGSLERKVHNGYMYGQNQAGSRGGTPDENFGDIDDHPEAAATSSIELAGLRARLFRAPATSLLNRKVQKEMIVPEWFPAHGMTALLSKRGGGKTVIMVDWALRLAHDMDWHGLPMLGGMTAVYACGEDDVGATEQVRAWLIQHKIENDDLSDRFLFFDTVPNLLSADDVREWAEFLIEEVPRPSRCVLFLDTWQRAASRGGQNKDEEMNVAVANVEGLARSIRGPVMAAFHPPKHSENTISGTAVLENSSMAILNLIKEAHGRKLSVTRQKGKGEGNYILFDFKQHDLGLKDTFGLQRTGIVAIKMGGAGSKEMVAIEEGTREGLAFMIKELEKDRHRQDTNVSDKFYVVSFIQTVTEMGPLAEQARTQSESTWTDEEKKAVEMTAVLIEKGKVNAWSKSAIKRIVTLHIINNPNSYHFPEDGTTLEVSEIGRRGRFFSFIPYVPPKFPEDDLETPIEM